MCQSNNMFKKSGLKVLKVNQNTDSHRFPPVLTGGRLHRRNSLLALNSPQLFYKFQKSTSKLRRLSEMFFQLHRRSR